MTDTSDSATTDLVATLRAPWPLIGRDHEVAIVRELVQERSSDRAIVLTGGAGVGKSRIAREAMAVAAQRDIPVQWFLCTSTSKQVPFGAFCGIVRDVRSDPPLGGIAEVVALLSSEPGTSSLIVVDDANHLDDLSALVIQRLVIERNAIVILTVRSGEALPEAIRGLCKDELLPLHEVLPLSAPQTASLLAASLGGAVDTSSAGRLWTFTRGNGLFLRQLVTDEVSAARLVKREEIWLWLGDPGMSSTLADLVHAAIGRQTANVASVLDVLVACEPLPLEVLINLVDPTAVVEAEKQGLVTIDDEAGGPSQARFTHPLVGEAHRAAAGALVVRRLRGIVADELARHPSRDPRDLIRRAVLLIDSDRSPSADLLCEAAEAALQMVNTHLATRLAQRAVALGAGRRGQMLEAIALGLGFASRRMMAAITAQGAVDAREDVRVAGISLAAAVWIDGDGDKALGQLPSFREIAERAGRPSAYLAFSSNVVAAMGDATRAVALSNAVADYNDLTRFEVVMAGWGRVIALTDLGRTAEALRAAHEVEAACCTFDTAPLLYATRWLHIRALLMAGHLTEVAALLDGAERDPRSNDSSGSAVDCAPVESALYRSELSTAIRLAREARARGMQPPAAAMMVCSWQAIAHAQLGEATESSEAWRAVPDLPLTPLWLPELDLAQGWVLAAAGDIGTAIAHLRSAVDSGRPGQEVLLLQTMTQFGDTGSAERLAELAKFVEGPRVQAARTHAAAAATQDGDLLLSASEEYERFGDLVAAADAAAQATVAYSTARRRGSALTASERAHRLAAACGGAVTPSIAAMSTPMRFTAREREVVTHLRRGLSNAEIAERLQLSLRTVENHIYRASQKIGAHSRAELSAHAESPEN